MFQARDLSRRYTFGSPLGDWRINWADPITGGLSFCVFPGRSHTMRDQVSGQYPVAGVHAGAAVPKVGMSSNGPAFLGSALAHPDADYPNPVTKWGTFNTYSMMAFCSVPAGTSGVANILDQDNNSGSPRVFQFRLNTNAAQFIVFNTGGTNFSVATATTYPTGDLVRGWTQVGIVDDAASKIRMISGIRGHSFDTAETAYTGTLRALDLSTNLTMFNTNGGSEQAFIGDIYIAALWRRRLDVVEGLRLCANPFCFLSRGDLSRSSTRRIYVPSRTTAVFT